MHRHPPLLPLNGGFDMAKMIRLGLALSLTLFVAAFLAGAGITAAQNGSPQFPHAFYGSVKYYSTPGGPYTNAPVDTVVTAKVDGDVKGQITVTEAGMYGGEGPGDLKLTVQDQICSGCVIEFWVDDKLAEEVRVQYDPGGPWYEVLPEWEVGFDSGEVWGLDLVYHISSTIAYSPTSFSFSATEGEANPSSRTLSIWNSGADPGAMAWSVTDNATWLSLEDPTSGTSSGEHDPVTVSVNILGLTAGSYSATITITAEGATNTPRTVPVSLTIAPPTPTPSPTPSPPLGPGVTPAGPGVTPVVTPTPPGPGVARSIEVTPAEASIEVGETHQFTATATYFDDSTADVTAEADWASSNTAVATVDAGLATGVGAGTIEITATFEGISDRAMLNVSVVLESIAVIPESASLDVGDTQQFTAIATYSDGSTRDVTAEADWASSNTAVATIDDAGLATGVAGGSTEITATFGGMTGAPASILTITAAPPAIPWWIIGLIIGLLLLLALLLLLRRRMRRGEEAAA